MSSVGEKLCQSRHPEFIIQGHNEDETNTSRPSSSTSYKHHTCTHFLEWPMFLFSDTNLQCFKFIAAVLIAIIYF